MRPNRRAWINAYMWLDARNLDSALTTQHSSAL